jgi:hypothetical protein
MESFAISSAPQPPRDKSPSVMFAVFGAAISQPELPIVKNWGC